MKYYYTMVMFFLLVFSVIGSVANAGSWKKCSDEHGYCRFKGTKKVAYGKNGKYVYKTHTNGVACENSVFGDPIYGTVKECLVNSAKEKECDFSPTKGRGKCFGAVGDQCAQGIKNTKNCTVRAFVTRSSILHDKCCWQHPNGKVCRSGSFYKPSEHLRRNAECGDEWDMATHDKKGEWFTFGPYDKK